jgi:hypothetical protein
MTEDEEEKGRVAQLEEANYGVTHYANGEEVKLVVDLQRCSRQVTTYDTQHHQR